ncbi:DUF998 domain-containing protein [Nonomuraea sp. 10N515B]|uniref:DUF998 domain-containing protein n=1 Tax=Nonomuraea sp. 10N515B TaxID=3457422 RepID=UPI003FCCB6DC
MTLETAMKANHTKDISTAAQSRALAIAGIVGPVLFTVGVLVQQFYRRDAYDPNAQMVSDLTASPFGWVQQVNFIVTGMLVIAFAAGLQRGVQPRQPRRAAPRPGPAPCGRLHPAHEPATAPRPGPAPAARRSHPTPADSMTSGPSWAPIPAAVGPPPNSPRSSGWTVPLHRPAPVGQTGSTHYGGFCDQAATGCADAAVTMCSCRSSTSPRRLRWREGG